MAYRSLSDPVDLLADWHLPESPDKRVAGRVQFNSRRVDLSLNGAFTPLQGAVSISDIQPYYPAIFGISNQGEALTVLKAQRTNVNFGFASAGVRQAEEIVASWLIVGAHTPAEQLYARVRFFIPGLEVWLSKPSIEHSVSFAEKSLNLQVFTVHQSQSEKSLIPSIDSTIEWGTGTKSSANVFKSVSIEILGWVTISPATPKPLEWFIEQQSKIVTMLAFLAGTPMPIDGLLGYLDDSPSSVSVLVAMPQTPRCTFKNLHDFFVPRAATGASLESVVSTWFAEIESTFIPSQLALSAISAKDLWLHVEFASLIQALEGFHRSRYEGSYMEDKPYEVVRKSLLDAIPASVSSDHKEALRSRIRYGNQISLAKRLGELSASLGEPLAKIILGDSGKVPRRWIDTRNYHSHWDEELRANIVDGQDMYNANVRMEHFVRALYLMLMGIPPALIVKAYENTSHSAQELSQLNVRERHRADPSQPPGVLLTIGVSSTDSVPSQPASAPDLGGPSADPPPENSGIAGSS